MPTIAAYPGPQVLLPDWVPGEASPPGLPEIQEAVNRGPVVSLPRIHDDLRVDHSPVEAARRAPAAFLDRVFAEARRYRLVVAEVESLRWDWESEAVCGSRFDRSVAFHDEIERRAATEGVLARRVVLNDADEVALDVQAARARVTNLQTGKTSEPVVGQLRSVLLGTAGSLRLAHGELNDLDDRFWRAPLLHIHLRGMATYEVIDDQEHEVVVALGSPRKARSVGPARDLWTWAGREYHVHYTAGSDCDAVVSDGDGTKLGCVTGRPEMLGRAIEELISALPLLP